MRPDGPQQKAGGRRTRAELIGSAPPLSQWPVVHAEYLPDDQKEKFNKRSRAIRLYLDGAPLSEIKEETGVNVSSISAFLKRCMLLHPDGNILGFRALVPNARIGQYTRTHDVMPKRPEQKGGHAGALLQLLTRLPQVEERLIAWVKKERKRQKVHEFRIRAVDLHSNFVRILRELGLTDQEWPFNTKLLGRRSITTYMNSILEADFDGSVRARESSDARAHLATSSGKMPLLYFGDPYDVVEVDAHHIDAHMTVTFLTPAGTTVEVRLSRLWLLAMIERKSGAALAYDIVYRSEVGADDVVNLLRKAINSPWKRLPLTIPGLQYREGSGLPSGVFPELSGALWGTLYLDGALANLSDAVCVKARKVVGNSVNFGAPGHFERRPNVERLFRRVHDDLFGRYPSTTGSNPQNGRAERGELAAEKLKIKAEDTAQMLDIYFSSYNAERNEGNFNVSPLECLREALEKGHFMPRKLPFEVPDGAQLFADKLSVVIRGGRKSGRRPFIQHKRVHYSNDILLRTAGLIGKRIFIEVDRDDLRQVKAYLPDGSSLGFLTAMGKWSLTRHDAKTRGAINSLIDQKKLLVGPGCDPVRAYMEFLSHGTRKNSTGTVDVPGPVAAMEAARVAKAGDLPMTITSTVRRPALEVPAPAYETPLVTDAVMPRPLPDLVDLLNKRGR